MIKKALCGKYVFFIWRKYLSIYILANIIGVWRGFSKKPVAGHVDFEKFFGFIRNVGYNDTFTVEASAVGADGVVDVDILNRQFEFIRSKSQG